MAKLENFAFHFRNLLLTLFFKRVNLLSSRKHFKNLGFHEKLFVGERPKKKNKVIEN